MTYRNGTYVAFHAAGTNQPGKSDIDYYNLMRAWSAKPDDEFTLINSHEKASVVRDTSLQMCIRDSLDPNSKPSFTRRKRPFRLTRFFRW